ncbi:hypothetical protein KXD97_15645 [Mycobacterium sp. SMC-8]|uniref:hypothetical protein n=1 Tax=Mycobacterium sp. SMC-8 TaxID=2857060 RepID=UPI0021B1A641|nr:hypothetical protein [Mycobacterium sp. SMC-8]UXA15047.1 hypothetical protein KXD97_15645 [Mycobacterium sp. SMC-8]
MNSNVFTVAGVAAAMSRTLPAQFWARPAHPITAAAVAAAPRKRRAAAGAIASVGGYL